MLLDRNDSIWTMEKKLAEAFKGVKRIGEIDLSEEDFKWLRRSVQNHYDNSRSLIPPPCVTAAVLVFCARYADYGEEEHIQFWDKFAQTVLKKPLSQALGNDWRDHFKAARQHLRQTYNFSFPTKEQSTQHVVNGIYQQAILPAYMAEEFVEWFLQHHPKPSDWGALHGRFPDDIAEELSRIPVAAPNKRLKRFLSDVQTSLTAGDLLKMLATAAVWYVQREMDNDDIEQLLSPFERGLWQRMRPRLPDPMMALIATQRDRPARMRWAWLYDQNDILELTISNLKLNGKVEPDRLVWVPHGTRVTKGETLPSRELRYCEVNAWKFADGYVIDTATLIDVREHGWVVAVDRGDVVLSAPIETPKPPTSTHDAILFKAQAGNSLAKLSDWNRLTSGDYAIVMKPDVTIEPVTERGGAVTRHYGLDVPQVLRAQGFTTAAYYTLQLPVTIGGEDINPKLDRVSPELRGERLVTGLAANALPVYQAGKLWMVFSPPKNADPSKLRLELSVNGQSKIYSLKALDAAGHLERQTDPYGGQVWKIDLSAYLSTPCLIEATLYNGFTAMHGEPRRAGVLPAGVVVEPDSNERYYSINRKPAVCLSGIGESQIRLASAALIDAVDEDDCIVTWESPREDAALRLIFDTVELPLTFDMKWSYGWVDGVMGNGELPEALVKEAILHVRGKPKAQFYIRLGAQDKTSPYPLTSHGTFDVEVRHDRLIDALMGIHEARTMVALVFADDPDTAIPLFQFVRPAFAPKPVEVAPQPVKAPELPPPAPLQPVAPKPSPTLPQNTPQTRTTPTPSNRWEAATLARNPHLAVLVAPREADALWRGKVPPVLNGVIAARRARSSLLDRFFPRKKTIIVIGDLTFELFKDAKGAFIEVPRSANGEMVGTPVYLHEQDGVTYLKANNPLLRQCTACDTLYWEDDRGAVTKHGHTRPKSIGRNLSKQPVQITQQAQKRWFIESHSASFLPFIDRRLPLTKVIRQRISKTPPTLSSSPPPKNRFTRDGYRYAVNLWLQTYTEVTRDAVGTFKRLDLNRFWNVWRRSQDEYWVWAATWCESELRAQLHQETTYPTLIPALLTLANEARAYAHHGVRTLDEQPLYDLLSLAYQHFAPLWEWALAWAELSIIYWKDETR